VNVNADVISSDTKDKSIVGLPAKPDALVIVKLGVPLTKIDRVANESFVVWTKNPLAPISKRLDNPSPRYPMAILYH
jgi:hypothetical protein